MSLFIEIITILWKTVTSILGAFVKVIIDLLPEFLQIKQIMGYFTPEGMVALWLGVPTILVGAVGFMVKKSIKGK